MFKISIGQIIKNLVPSEPVTINQIQELGSMVSVRYTGINSSKVSTKVITKEEFDELEILSEEGTFNFKGDPTKFGLFAEAERINSAYQFDPLFAVNCSIVDPLPHQVEAVYKFLLPLPKIRFLLADDTGAGKTITTATLSHITESYGRSLVIVPNKSLVEQTEEDYINCGLDVGVYFGDRKQLGKTHTICTWQSLNILNKKTKDGSSLLSLAEFLEGVSTIIIDEVHQAKAEVLKNLLTQNLRNAPIRWGLTGTVPKEKFEFESIHASLGPVIGNISAKELQDKGVLSQCHVNIVQLLDTVAHSNYQEELKYLVTNTKRIEYLGKLLNTIKQSGNTLILVDRISAGQALAELIPDSTFISGSVKTRDRKETYDTIKEGTNEVIIATYGVAAVGLNIPRIFNLVLLEPGKSFVRVIQSIGRGVRKAKDKDFVQIWDLTSTCKFAKRHLTQRKKFYKEAQYPFTIEKIDWS